MINHYIKIHGLRILLELKKENHSIISINGRSNRGILLRIDCNSQPLLAVTMPIVLSLAPCLVMCGAIGGSMWFVQRRGNKNTHSCSCGIHHDLPKVEDKNRELQDSKDHISDLKNLQTDQEK